MNKSKLVYVLSGFLVLAGLVSFSGLAMADRDEDEDKKDQKIPSSMMGFVRSSEKREDSHKKEAKLDGSTLEVSIKDNGQVLVRGAKVSAVTGNTISATTAWGSMNLNWTLNVTSNTNIVRKFGSVSPLAEVKVGDMVSFTGTVNSATSTSTAIVVDAKVIKNWSVTKQNVRSKIEGTVKSIAGTVAPTNMVVTSGSKDYTVSVATTTSVVNEDWTNTTLASFVVGDKVTAYGVVNDTTLTVNATVLRQDD